MLEVLFATHSWPFAAALGVVVLMALLEILGLLIGYSPFHAVDNALADFDTSGPDLPGGDGFFASALEWLAVGRVPIIVIIVSFLTAFGIAGLVIERVAIAATGHYVPTLLAALGAFALALPATRTIGFGLARVLPKDESEAVSVEAFVGKVATITLGTSRRGVPAEAKLTDAYGKTHYIRVEPDDDGDTFAQGTSVLVVTRAGSVYRVIAVPNAALKPS